MTPRRPRRRDSLRQWATSDPVEGSRSSPGDPSPGRHADRRRSPASCVMGGVVRRTRPALLRIGATGRPATARGHRAGARLGQGRGPDDAGPSSGWPCHGRRPRTARRRAPCRLRRRPGRSGRSRCRTRARRRRLRHQSCPGRRAGGSKPAGGTARVPMATGPASARHPRPGHRRPATAQRHLLVGVRLLTAVNRPLRICRINRLSFVVSMTARTTGSRHDEGTPE